jgi:hypothetical protein
VPVSVPVFPVTLIGTTLLPLRLAVMLNNLAEAERVLRVKRRKRISFFMD